MTLNNPRIRYSLSYSTIRSMHLPSNHFTQKNSPHHIIFYSSIHLLEGEGQRVTHGKKFST